MQHCTIHRRLLLSVVVVSAATASLSANERSQHRALESASTDNDAKHLRNPASKAESLAMTKQTPWHLPATATGSERAIYGESLACIIFIAALLIPLVFLVVHCFVSEAFDKEAAESSFAGVVGSSAFSFAGLTCLGLIGVGVLAFFYFLMAVNSNPRVRY
eukprot:gnl/MRDRNA2_/MRDRNA2_29871_c0_seq1.p1 gnl/MRDRNA2_/MRDRNA2_29871_c0~~gnl/MRDRNA2_/MRDRNA2_29871_c0_seq1.p1  ORF type:complete len:161 (+),score=25.70 gnl/MRDRNA2_/MRDRNA2_29871_c0_seq1:67-549(+)